MHQAMRPRQPLSTGVSAAHTCLQMSAIHQTSQHVYNFKNVTDVSTPALTDPRARPNY